MNDDESSGGSSIMHSRIIILAVSCIGSNFSSSCYAYTELKLSLHESGLHKSRRKEGTQTHNELVVSVVYG